MSSEPLRLKIARLTHATDLPLPAYKSADAAGLDLTAAISAATPLVIAPGNSALVDTGFVVAIPSGHEGQIRPRSGLALEHGLTVLNTPGTIDADYRGEIKVLLVNHGKRDVVVARGMRIAQLIVAPIIRAAIAEVSETEIGETARGGSGFGSTGTV